MWARCLLICLCLDLTACASHREGPNGHGGKTSIPFPSELSGYRRIASGGFDIEDAGNRHGPMRIEFARYALNGDRSYNDIFTYNFDGELLEIHNLMRHAEPELENAQEVGSSLDVITGEPPIQLHWVMTKYVNESDNSQGILMTTRLENDRFVTMASYYYSENPPDEYRVFLNAIAKLLWRQNGAL